jgi:hypothetical protein
VTLLQQQGALLLTDLQHRQTLAGLRLLAQQLHQ